MKNTLRSPRSKEIKRLRERADALIQEITRAEHPVCEYCGGRTQVGHHIFTKGSSSALRYMRENIAALCNGCHFSHHNGNPRIHEKIIADRGGRRWFRRMEKSSNELTKRSKAYYLGVIEMLEE